MPDPIMPAVRDGTMSPSPHGLQLPVKTLTGNPFLPPTAAPSASATAAINSAMSPSGGNCQRSGALNRSSERVQRQASGHDLNQIHHSASAGRIIIRGVPAVDANGMTPTSPSGNFSFIAKSGDTSLHSSPSRTMLADQDHASITNDSTSASVVQSVQVRPQSNRSAEGSISAPAGQKTVESRIASMEASVKSFDRMLKEYQPAPEQDMMNILKRFESLAAQLDEQRKSRKMFEDRAKQLEKLLRHERGEREAWLVAFANSLHSTLQELTDCIDRSISDSSQLIARKMDNTDEIMSHLIDRVDQLLIQRESELDTVQGDR